MTNKGHSRHETLGSEQTVTPRQSHVRTFRCCWPGGLSSPASRVSLWGEIPSAPSQGFKSCSVLMHHTELECVIQHPHCVQRLILRGGKKKKGRKCATTMYSHNFQPVSKTRFLHPKISPFPEAFYFPRPSGFERRKKKKCVPCPA